MAPIEQFRALADAADKWLVSFDEFRKSVKQTNPARRSAKNRSRLSPQRAGAQSRDLFIAPVEDAGQIHEQIAQSNRRFGDLITGIGICGFRDQKSVSTPPSATRLSTNSFNSSLIAGSIFGLS